jgi:hypothetical protein
MDNGQGVLNEALVMWQDPRPASGQWSSHTTCGSCTITLQPQAMEIDVRHTKSRITFMCRNLGMFVLQTMTLVKDAKWCWAPGLQYHNQATHGHCDYTVPSFHISSCLAREGPVGTKDTTCCGFVQLSPGAPTTTLGWLQCLTINCRIVHDFSCRYASQTTGMWNLSKFSTYCLKWHGCWKIIELFHKAFGNIWL